MTSRRPRRTPTRPPRSGDWSPCSTPSPRARPRSSRPRRPPPRTSGQPAASPRRRCLLQRTQVPAPTRDTRAAGAAAPTRMGERRRLLLLLRPQITGTASLRVEKERKPEGPRGWQKCRHEIDVLGRRRELLSIGGVRFSVLLYPLIFVHEPLIPSRPRRLNPIPVRRLGEISPADIGTGWGSSDRRGLS